jgi:hypothetical protein
MAIKQVNFQRAIFPIISYVAPHAMHETLPKAQISSDDRVWEMTDAHMQGGGYFDKEQDLEYFKATQAAPTNELYWIELGRDWTVLDWIPGAWILTSCVSKVCLSVRDDRPTLPSKVQVHLTCSVYISLVAINARMIAFAQDPGIKICKTMPMYVHTYEGPFPFPLPTPVQ